MRIRLEYLYRMLCECNDPDGFIEGQTASNYIATAGLVLICKHRHNDHFQTSDSEAELAREFSEIVSEKFNTITMRIREDCDGLPITLTFSKHEINLQVGLDEMIEELKGFFKESEVANG